MKTPAHGLHVGRRLVELGDRVEGQIEHLDGELTTGDHHGPPAAHPAGIGQLVRVRALEGLRPLLVDAGIEHPDHLAVHLQAVGDPDRLVEGLAQGQGDGGLAVAGSAVEQHRAARVGGGAQAGQHAVGQDQVAQGGLDRLGRDVVAADRLGGHLGPVGLHGDRRRTRVLALGQGLDGPVAAEAGQRVAVGRVARVGQAQHLDQPLLLGLLQHLAHHQLGQVDVLGQLRRGLQVGDVDRLQQEAQQELALQAGLLDGLRRPRRGNAGSVAVGRARLVVRRARLLEGILLAIHLDSSAVLLFVVSAPVQVSEIRPAPRRQPTRRDPLLRPERRAPVYSSCARRNVTIRPQASAAASGR